MDGKALVPVCETSDLNIGEVNSKNQILNCANQDLWIQDGKIKFKRLCDVTLWIQFQDEEATGIIKPYEIVPKNLLNSTYFKIDFEEQSPIAPSHYCYMAWLQVPGTLTILNGMDDGAAKTRPRIRMGNGTSDVRCPA